MPRCAVYGCGNSDRQTEGRERIEFYSFPKQKPYKKFWENFCGKVENFNTSVICSKHFDPILFRNNSNGKEKSLFPNALPTLKGPISICSPDKPKHYYKLENTCRICLKQELKNELLIPIFYNENFNQLVYPIQPIQEFNLFEVRENDGMPQNVCSDCMDRLLDITEFKKTCETSQGILETYFKFRPDDLVNLNVGNAEHSQPKKIKVENELEIVDSPDSLNLQSKFNLGNRMEIDFIDEHDLDDVMEDNTESFDNFDDDLSTDNVDVKVEKKVLDENTLAKKPPLGRSEVSQDQADVKLCNSDSEVIKLEITSDEKSNRLGMKTVEKVLKKVPCNMCNADGTDEHKNYPAEEADEEYYLATDSDNSENSTKVTKPKKKNSKRKVRRIPKFQCNVCNQRYVLNEVLLQHRLTKGHYEEDELEELMRQNGKVIKVPCHRCDEFFTKYHELQIHKSSECEAIKTLICRICNGLYADIQLLDKHLNEVHPVSHPYSCSVCGKSFKRTGELNLHVATHNEERKYACDMCDKAYRTIHLLNGHKSNCHSKKISVCDQCGLSFDQRRAYLAHLLKHKEKRFKCRFCDKSFHLRHHWRNHEAIHSENRSFLCNICGSGFKTETTLKNHERIHMDISDRKKYGKELRDLGWYVCQMLGCESRSPSILAFLRHNELDHSEIPDLDENYVREPRKLDFTCIICNLTFIDRMSYTLHKNNNHKDVNLKDKNTNDYKCDECGKEFFYFPKFISHQVDVHKRDPNDFNVGDFSCDICNKTFSGYVQLQVHKKNHTLEKTYQCSICNNIYKRKAQLNGHFNRVHLKLRPFGCDVCGQKFGQTSDRNAHMRKVHKLMLRTERRPRRLKPFDLPEFDGDEYGEDANEYKEFEILYEYEDNEGDPQNQIL